MTMLYVLESTYIMQDIMLLNFVDPQNISNVQAKCVADKETIFIQLPVAHFLHQSLRTLKAIQRDGNCLFRCVAFHTLGDENNHDAIRTLLVRFEHLNKALFAPRFYP